MNRIKEIWAGFTQTPVEAELNLPLQILEHLANEINKDAARDEVCARVVTVTGVASNEVIHSLYLLPVYGNGYNYRFIELAQPIDAFFPVHVTAFQSGNSDFGTVAIEQGEDGIYETLQRIFGDPRTKIVFAQLKSMGNTARGWNEQLGA